MSFTHPIAIRNEIIDLVVDKCDEGSTNPTGALVIMESDDTVLATLLLSNPAFGDAAAGASTADTITSATASASGTAAKFQLQDRDRNEVASGSLTAVGGGGDMEAGGTSLSISSGDTVEVSSLVYNGQS